MATYSYATLGEVLGILGGRLYDPEFQMWTSVELTLYLQEALQFWNALTGAWRGQMIFGPVAGQMWYDLNAIAGTLRFPFVSPSGWFSSLQYRLLEPQNTAYPLVWGGSGQFNFPVLSNALSRRYSEALQLSGCTLQRVLVNAPISRRVQLPDTCGDIRRVAWIPAVPNGGYFFTVMAQTDVLARHSFNFGWTTGGEKPPRTWAQSTQPPIAFDVDNVPPVPGKYDVVTVVGGEEISTQAEVNNLVFPMDWNWMVVWGALQDLLGNESNAKDSHRAAYCQMRYSEALKLLSLAPAIVDAYLNNIPLPVQSLYAGDNFNPRWVGSAGEPRTIYMGGLNLFALSPVPDGGNYSLGLTVVENAPLPQVEADFVQVSREDLDTILDYAQHVALFKIGGAEFNATVPMYRRFLARASVVSAKLNGQGEFQKQIYELSQLEDEKNPRFSPTGALEEMNA